MKRLLMVSVSMSVFALTLSVGESDAAQQEFAALQQKKQALESRQESDALSGKVIETMDSSGYTYVRIEKDGVKTWIAVPQMKVTVGQEAAFYPGMTMNNFTSKTLNRTFETIVFSSGIVGEQETESKNSTMTLEKSKASSDTAINVEKASGPNAYTVAELYEKRTELSNKTVVFRGKAVKFSSNIMGKNWIHIQDGSGNPSKGTNDILVTSQDTLSEGDVVTIEGTLSTDKDFGSGYRYAVIIEQAHIQN